MQGEYAFCSHEGGLRCLTCVLVLIILPQSDDTLGRLVGCGLFWRGEGVMHVGGGGFHGPSNGKLIFSRAVSTSGATYLVTMACVWLCVCTSVSHVQTGKNFFLRPFHRIN